MPWTHRSDKGLISSLWDTPSPIEAQGTSHITWRQAVHSGQYRNKLRKTNPQTLLKPCYGYVNCWGPLAGRPKKHSCVLPDVSGQAASGSAKQQNCSLPLTVFPCRCLLGRSVLSWKPEIASWYAKATNVYHLLRGRAIVLHLPDLSLGMLHTFVDLEKALFRPKSPAS